MRLACNAVFILVRDDESINRLASLSVAELLSDVVITYSSQSIDTTDTIDVALIAMSVIETLLHHPALLVRFADKAVLSYCLDLLEHRQAQFTSTYLEKVCSVICQFAAWKEQYVGKMNNRNVCEMVMNAYIAQENVSAVVAIAMSSVVLAMSTTDDTIDIFLKMKTPSMLLDLLRTFGDDEMVIAAACVALVALSVHPSFGSLFITDTADDDRYTGDNRYTHLVCALRKFVNIKPVVESSLDLIINSFKNSTEHSESHTTLLLQANLCELMPEILRKHYESAAIISKCCRVMSDLCLNEEAADILSSCGACEGVTKALELFTNDAGVAQYGCTFIR
jgi:hypothetical protein